MWAVTVPTRLPNLLDFVPTFHFLCLQICALMSFLTHGSLDASDFCEASSSSDVFHCELNPHSRSELSSTSQLKQMSGNLTWFPASWRCHCCGTSTDLAVTSTQSVQNQMNDVPAGSASQSTVALSSRICWCSVHLNVLWRCHRDLKSFLFVSVAGN